jgi:hypothetical protein
MAWNGVWGWQGGVVAAGAPVCARRGHGMTEDLRWPTGGARGHGVADKL